jgi:putative aldouronate transport system substrate-binding protein
MRFRKLAIVVTAGMVLTTACSSQGGTNTNDPTPTKTPAPNEKDRKITIKAMKFGFGELPPNDAPGVKLINDRYNVDYQINQVPQASYGEKLSAVLASGSIPDMIAFEAPDLTNRYAKFAKQKAFLPLDDYIKKYPSLSAVPDFVWDQFRVDGKIYAIPKYYPRFGFLPMIRQDWLDNLGLKVPTNYEELKKVAIAFTKDDPDKNGKNDTYGIALGKDINPNYNLGAYWDPAAWYHKNEKGEFIPGIISPARKEQVQWFADLYKQNAITRDFATIDWNATNKEFYSGQAGIFIGTPRGMIQANSDSLVKIDPKAKFTFMAPAVAPDSSKGLASSSGYSGFMTISAEAGKDPEKVRRILEMTEAPRTIIAPDKSNPDNKDFDWLMGGLGVGYDMVNGAAVSKANALKDGLRPTSYLLDDVSWPKKESDKIYKYSNPVLDAVVQEMVKLHGESKFYGSPHYSVASPTQVEKGAELNKFILDEQTKMIAGQRPISDWDTVVKEWMAKGGAQWIQEVNAGTKLKDPKTAWE